MGGRDIKGHDESVRAREKPGERGMIKVRLCAGRLSKGGGGVRMRGGAKRV